MVAERLRVVPGSVRLRTTVAAVAVVGVPMVVGAVVMVVVLRSTLTREVRAAARLRAEDVAAVLAADAGSGAALHRRGPDPPADDEIGRLASGCSAGSSRPRPASGGWSRPTAAWS